jgi:tetratricopeptide (TPR) repeat protein
MMKCHKFRMVVSAASALLLLGSLAACGGKKTTEPPEKTAAEFIAEGWGEYRDASYEDGGRSFDDALQKEPGNRSALLGRGWCRAKVGDPTGAAADLIEASGDVGLRDDAEAGLAFVHLAAGAYQPAISAAAAVLSRNPAWTFGHAARPDARSLYLLTAQAHFALGDFEEALSAVVDHLNASFHAAVSTPEGRAELAVEIERLRVAMDV